MIILKNWNTFADISTIDVSCTESKRNYGKQHSCFCKAVEVVEDFMGYALKEEVDLLGYIITFYLRVSINFCYYFFFQCQVPYRCGWKSVLVLPQHFT